MFGHLPAHLSIKERMGILSKRSIIALSIILGCMGILAFQISSSMNDSMRVGKQLDLIKDAQFSVVEISLSAMDSLVDKEEGMISKDRLKTLEDNFSKMETVSLVEISKDLGNHQKLLDVKSDLPKLKSAVLKDLKSAIEIHADEATFAQLDDTIDTLASGISDSFSVLSGELRKQQDETLEFSRLGSSILTLSNLVLFVILAFGFYKLIIFIQKSIVSPLESVAMTTINSITSSANNLSTSAQHLDKLMIGAAAATLQGAERASLITQSVEGVAAAVEELSSSIGEIRRQATISTEVSTLAVKEAVSMGETIQNLNVATEGIGAITELINKIAESTNLLALNATIETARAGDAGKGFAVVATEVKNLAVKTAEATDEINSKVEEMQNMVARAVAAIGNIQETISEINHANSGVMTSVEQQSIATEEITRTLNEATIGLQGTSDMISEINTTIQATKTDSDQVLKASNHLLTQANESSTKTRALIDGKKA